MSYLGVETSLTGRRWIGPSDEVERLAQTLMQRAEVEPAVAAILARRGVQPEEVVGFLAPALRDLLPDPMTLKDMEPAATRLVAAARKGERIAIFADYDVDGGASAALLICWLRALGREATLYIPDRIDEGYGPNEEAMAMLARDHDLIICVDCGTLSHGPIAAAKGADVMVLDHHLALAELPECVAVVNPNRQDEDGSCGHLCAAGVVFLVLVEANRRMRAAGESGPDLMGFLDLVALATVADVAPLVGVNRALVVQGLKVMARRQRPGLVALCDVGRLDRAPTSYHLGFVLGPRVNAGGRIGAADLGARCLSTDNAGEAGKLAAQLDSLNTDRRDIEQRVREAALAQCETRGLDAPLIWAAEDGWHPGVVGIVASRLKDHSRRPAMVIGFDGDEGKGSGRSVAGVDLGASIQKLAAEGLIQKGGGHKMAAGLSLSRAQLEPAMARLTELLAKQGAGTGGAGDLRLDGTLMPSAATPELIEKIEAAGPYGAGAPAPRFALPALRIRHTRPVGENHLKLTLGDGGPVTLDAICFDAVRSGLDALQAHNGRAVHVAGRVELNHWQGRTRVQLRLDDAAWAEN
ncbi:single-stranded-DNA-specific exonuclease RecJ [Gymnodinialimonas ceratoperidinii]|uniref:Single-stranded-DNA-specific exonuclease RecJ n=1 Tax=Gymnodinialimonas ceratoperidinii TaxID=2856823 RepID=A0A8F6YBJ5_9RHOB|nr:single-stranded-DNA-specific exonuclease RecJ [Gymnodinialimonas ceratoperidinii]QXT41034.1 single-stranded-DNA-specific exonuclease RecJ [Gymnodinialimonas ceratoperidinii]